MDAWIGRKNTFEFSNSNQNIQKKSIYCPSQSSTRSPLNCFSWAHVHLKVWSFSAHVSYISAHVPNMILMPLFRETRIFTISCSMCESPIMEGMEDYCLAQKRWCWFNALHHKVEPYVRMGIVPRHMLTQSRYYHETIPPQYKYLERCIIVTS